MFAGLCQYWHLFCFQCVCWCSIVCSIAMFISSKARLSFEKRSNLVTLLHIIRSLSLSLIVLEWCAISFKVSFFLSQSSTTLSYTWTINCVFLLLFHVESIRWRVDFRSMPKLHIWAVSGVIFFDCRMCYHNFHYHCRRLHCKSLCQCHAVGVCVTHKLKTIKIKRKLKQFPIHFRCVWKRPMNELKALQIRFWK